MSKINYGDVVTVKINSFHNPVCICSEVVTTINSEGITKDYTFTETKRGRTHVSHSYSYKNKTWFKDNPPFTLSHDPDPEHYLKKWTSKKLNKEYTPKLIKKAAK